MNKRINLGGAGLLLALGASAYAEPVRVVVTIENLAPQRGTSQTPFWVGFHDGDFDTYDANTPASAAMESLCEDGDTTLISSDFATGADGVDATIAGPGGPFGPGDTGSGSFVLDTDDVATRFFSYASMVLPSNDFCVSNGNPEAHEVIDENGDVVAESFFITGAEVLDAGTEVNDEAPENTAFFGQSTPDTGDDENGLIGDADDRGDFVGFKDPSEGGILADPRFAMADFTATGYPIAKISFASAPAITDEFDFRTDLSGDNEVPVVDSAASGNVVMSLREGGTVLNFRVVLRGLSDIVAAHLHLAPEGENGPVVAFLLPAGLDPSSREGRVARRFFRGSLSTGDLSGPLLGQPLDALISAIEAGNVYVNIHSSTSPSGEVRGQLAPQSRPASEI